MLLPGVDEEGAKNVVEKIKNTLRAEDFIYRGKTLNVKINVVAITYREEDLHLEQMLQEGDLELFKIKQQTA
ncbi:MAG: hypothetical protein IIC60_13530 [Proteobacteria bacterium]|nr:hypothetical protein [Pseudomonadota bacterium]